MVDVIIFGILASSALVIGGVVGFYWQAPKQVTGVLLAFASGTLISALAFELFPQAVELGGLARSGVGLLVGAGAFVLVDTWLERRAAPTAALGEKADHNQIIEEGATRASGSPSVGLALLASVILDGIPENLALGVSMQAEASLTLLVAIFSSNLPEALVGAIAMRQAGRNGQFVIGIWSMAALVLVLVVVLGNFLGRVPDEWLSFLLAFAGGAVLASLADTLMPEAFERGRPVSAFATAVGFFVSFALAGGNSW